MISGIAETTWRPQRIREVLLALSRSTVAFRGLTGHVAHPIRSIVSRQLPLRSTAYPRGLPAISLIPVAPLLHRDKRAKIGFMGHNKGRDNAKKRAKRRKKYERLAAAKQPSRDATARRGQKAGK